MRFSESFVEVEVAVFSYDLHRHVAVMRSALGIGHLIRFCRRVYRCAFGARRRRMPVVARAGSVMGLIERVLFFSIAPTGDSARRDSAEHIE